MLKTETAGLQKAHAASGAEGNRGADSGADRQASARAPGGIDAGSQSSLPAASRPAVAENLPDGNAPGFRRLPLHFVDPTAAIHSRARMRQKSRHFFVELDRR